MLRRMLNVLIGLMLRARRRRFKEEGRCPAFRCGRDAVPGSTHCESHRPARRWCCCSSCLMWVLTTLAWWYWENNIANGHSEVWIWLDKNIVQPIAGLLNEIANAL